MGNIADELARRRDLDPVLVIAYRRRSRRARGRRPRRVPIVVRALAVLLVAIGGAAMGLAIATFWATPAALGSGQPGLATGAVAAGLVVYGGLVLVLVPRHGPMGAAISVLGGYAALGVIITTLWAGTLRGSRSEARPSEQIGGPERSAACSRRASQIGQ